MTMTDEPSCSSAPSGSPPVPDPAGTELELIGSQRRKRRIPSRIVAEPVVSSTNEDVNVALDDETSSKTTDVRQKARWDAAASFCFFDALKLHGKDFEQISKTMNRHHRKTGKRDYVQVRNFYYNTLKGMSFDTELAHVSTQVTSTAKELFLLVNFSEWRRKTGMRRVPPVHRGKFLELVLKGSASVRVRGRGFVHIRTPHCACLRRFCEDTSAPLFTEVTIECSPCTVRDKVHVLQCEQNPYVRAKLKENELIKNWLLYLRRKWVPVELRKKQQSLEMSPADYRIPELTLRVADDSLLCDTTVTSRVTRWTTATGTFSLNRCSKRYAAIKQEPTTTTASGGEDSTSRDACSNTEDSNDAIGSTTTTTNPQQQQRQRTASSGPEDTTSTSTAPAPSLELDVNKLATDGINIENVGNLTAGQLAIMCDSSPLIRLVYEIKPIADLEQSGPEPWQCLMTLLQRGFSDELMKPESKSQSVLAGAPTAQKLVTSPAPLPIPKVSNPKADKVVEAENAQFHAQIANYKKARGRKTIVSSQQTHRTSLFKDGFNVSCTADASPMSSPVPPQMVLAGTSATGVLQRTILVVSPAPPYCPSTTVTSSTPAAYPPTFSSKNVLGTVLSSETLQVAQPISTTHTTSTSDVPLPHDVRIAHQGVQENSMDFVNNVLDSDFLKTFGGTGALNENSVGSMGNSNSLLRTPTREN